MRQKNFDIPPSTSSNCHNSTQWLQTELDKQYIPTTKQSEGVYFCAANTMFAAVILIDQCSNHAFLQAGFLCAVPHCLITEHPVYSNTTGSTISHISEFTSGAKNLTKEIEKCILQFGENKPANPLACVIPAMPAANSDKLILSRSDKDIGWRRKSRIG
jgi:hypothetical protein